MCGDPSRTNICNEINGLFWQTGLTGSIDIKALYAALANQEVRHARAA